MIQLNALRSWTLIRPRPEILLFGDDPGTAEVASQIGARHFPNVDRNEYGTPLVNSIFKTAQKEASHDLLCYANADIIFPGVLPDIPSMVPFKKFLIVGRRWDMELNRFVDFQEIDWEKQLHAEAQQRGQLHPPSGSDYFLFPRGVYENIPAFAIGRTVWDNWLIFAARLNDIPVIDATDALTVIHQNHEYGIPQGTDGIWKGPEALKNLELAGGFSSVFELIDANFLLSHGKLKRRPLRKRMLSRELNLRTKRHPESAFLYRMMQKLLKPGDLWRSVLNRARRILAA